MPVPRPTPILRFLHVENLATIIQRGKLHSPNHAPNDGLSYKTIHNVDVQSKRAEKRIPCGSGGVIHDYVPFYFGYLSPMMLNLKTGRVPGYSEGQEPLIYLSSTAQGIADSGKSFVFSDGHGVPAFTSWFDDLSLLKNVSWDIVNERYWRDNANDMDRQRKKQAEFLVYLDCDWSMIDCITVIDDVRKRMVEKVFSNFNERMHRPIVIERDWYYY